MRQPARGMGQAVARRTVFRNSDNQDWGSVARRVAEGNCSLGSVGEEEQSALEHAIGSGVLLTSGRHLQHGDKDQINRSQEVYTNCATSATTYGLAYLLLNGSGVGRSYDDDMMLVDWDRAPKLWMILSPRHPDFPHTLEAKWSFYRECTGDWDTDEPQVARDFCDRYIHVDLYEDEPPPQGNLYCQIEDSREGWARAVEMWEAAAYRGGEEILILNFSKIRAAGSPIGGMQDRPCSGPVSWIRAFCKAERNVVGRGMPRWEQAMRIDHHFAEEVLVAGARRSARMSTKSWRDPGIFDFIRIKNEGGLWTSNNSIMVDAEFWRFQTEGAGRLAEHARRVFGEATENSFIAGEPGLINGDKLEDAVRGYDRRIPVGWKGEAFDSAKYQTVEGRKLLADLAARANNTRFASIINPCAEVTLSVMGGFCVIADLAPILACPVDWDQAKYSLSSQQFAEWDNAAREACRLGVRFLIRVNQMASVYHQEVRRTNRIGISLTGIHEWAYLRFGYTFHDLLDETKSAPFWSFVAELSDLAKAEANAYSDELGMPHPFTITTIKPSGTISKLFLLSEGAHLPARRQYLRWVQFKGTKVNGEWQNADPLLPEYEARGYPVRCLETFPGMSIVGFPTMLLPQRLMGSDMVTALEATPEEQYQWVRLLERYWIGARQGNQISYTLKVDTSQHSLEDYRRIVLENQPTIRCCSVLPYHPDKDSIYEYLPESEISPLEFQRLLHHIQDVDEVIDMESLRCESGVCPI